MNPPIHNLFLHLKILVCKLEVLLCFQSFFRNYSVKSEFFSNVKRRGIVIGYLILTIEDFYLIKFLIQNFPNLFYNLIKNIEYLQGAAMDSLKCPDHLRTPQLTDNARLVLARRYRKINPDTGEQESEEHLFWRTSATIAAAEEAYPSSPWKAADLSLRFYDLLTEGKFLPNSPTLMNAGLPLGQLAACFVLPIGDSIEEIFDAGRIHSWLGLKIMMRSYLNRLATFTKMWKSQTLA